MKEGPWSLLFKSKRLWLNIMSIVGIICIILGFFLTELDYGRSLLLIVGITLWVIGSGGNILLLKNEIRTHREKDNKKKDKNWEKMKMLPFRIKMKDAIKEYCEIYKFNEIEVTKKLEIDNKKEKMTALSFHKKYGKFLDEEGRKISSEILMFHAAKTVKLGIYISFIGILFIVIGIIILNL